MKNIRKFSLLAMAGCLLLLSCSKGAKVAPLTGMAALSGSWTTATWGGVAGDPLTMTIDANTSIGTVTAIGSTTFGFATSDQIFTNIVATSGTTFTATGEYSPNGSTPLATRSCTFTLQGTNNKQLVVDYPALNNQFPEVIYLYIKN